MNPIYKFQLSVGNDTHQAFPVYKDDLAKEFEKQTNQMFFRVKLSGKLTFESDDYHRINAAAFDTKFSLDMFISYDAGQNWTSYWKSEFWKTDCTFDEDAETVTVTPSTVDAYTDILAGMEKEFNLIDLAPEIQHIRIDKRPMVQVYVPGQASIGCFLSGMWWEQECEVVEESDTVMIGGDNLPALIYKYFFAKVAAERIVEVSQTGTPVLPSIFMDAPWEPAYEQPKEIEKDGYIFRDTITISGDWWAYRMSILDATTEIELWAFEDRLVNRPELPAVITLNPVEGSGATGTVELFLHDVNVYARMICNVDEVANLHTNLIPSDDLVPDNRNYKYAIAYEVANMVAFSDKTTSTPTKYGLKVPGVYYVSPDISGTFYPVSRNIWGEFSVWFYANSYNSVFEEAARARFTLEDAFPISSVISVLLSKIGSTVEHRGTPAYSQFLYGVPGGVASPQSLFITPKSNIITSGYDQPAQKALIKLKTVMDMLRECYQCYWFVEDGKFKIEHIRYFKGGGSYTGDAVVGVDLTDTSITRNGKAWSFGRNQYTFDKPEMAARYQFGWMDDVTEIFEGYPIDILSGYVNKDNVETINVSQFTSDVDFILLNPNVISKDGFVLLAAALDDGEYYLPYYHYESGSAEYYLQNGFAAFVFLEDYRKYDMPAKNYAINGSDLVAIGIKRMKEQSIKFPMMTDPNCVKLVKTELGDGEIQKISVNLSSRIATATLRYDTE